MKSNIIHTKILNMGIRIFIAIFVVTIFLYWQNNDIVVTEFEYKNGKIPAEFDGFSIVQVSDLHNKQFGKNQQKLITEIERSNPDIIVITGDLVDRRKYNLETSMEFVNQAVKYAPVYYVSGNH
ncbi:MAG: metallophosphoesterase, partial [Proteocatella sp.]